MPTEATNPTPASGPPARIRTLYAIAIVISLVLAGLGIYRQVAARQSPAGGPRPVAMTLAPAPVTVSLSLPTKRTTAALGAPNVIAVNAAGPTLTEVRLYDGATLVGTKRFEPAVRDAVSVSMTWTPTSPGAHLLHASAVGDTPSAVGHSGPLRLHAVDAVVAQPAVASTNAAPISPPQHGPLALTARLTDCRSAIDANTAVTIYELTGGGAGFVQRGKAGPGSPYRSEVLTPGPHVYVAGVDEGPATSDPISVTVPTTCQSTRWSSGATLFDGELSLPKPAAQVWVYLSADDEPFQRVPATGTVSAAFGTADLSGLLPPLQGRSIKMEVWQPGATPNAPATRLAQSNTTLAEAQQVSDILGASAGVRISGPSGATSIDMAPTDTEIRFAWHTENLTTTGVVWQVLGRPLQPSDRNTAPPVLLATGYTASGEGGGVQLSGQGGSFTIPAGLLLGGRPATSLGAAPIAAVPTPPIQQLLKPGSSFGTTPLTGLDSATLPQLKAGIVPVPVGDVYVRVLPVVGQSVVGDASNTVAVTLPELSDTTAGFTGTQVTFDPGYAANPELTYCVRVTNTPDKGASPFYPQDGTYCVNDFERKGNACLGWCIVAKDLTSLVDYVGKVWDYLAQAYNSVVDTVIETLARFNPLCLSAAVADSLSDSPYASQASSGCESIGRVVASVVVTVVLSSFGLPAQLPTTTQLANIAQGDLTALAVAYLEQLGVPCSTMTADATTVSAASKAGLAIPAAAKGPDGSVGVCAALINQAIGAIHSEVKKVADSEVANTTGLPIPPAPQQFTLEPRGRYHGAEIQVVATPIDPNTKTTARCYVGAAGSVPSWNVGGFEGTKVRRIGNAGGFVAYNPGASSPGKPWMARLLMPAIDDLYADETIKVTLTSPCFASGTLKTIPPTPLKPPLGRWLPGQSD